MLKYFNSGYFSRTTILLFLAVLMWLPAFLLPAKTIVPQYPAPLYQLFLFITGDNTYFQLAIAFAFTITGALLINQIATEFGISEKISQLATLVYILFSAAMASFTAMSPFVIINFLMLFFLGSLFKIAEAKETIPLAFNAALVLGIASLFYLPALLFILLLWVSFMIFRVSQWRNFAVSIIGLLVPFLFVFTWYYWNDQSGEFRLLFLSSFQLSIADMVNYSISDSTMGIVLLILIVLSLVKTSNSLMEKTISIRQILNASMYYLLLAFVLGLLFTGSNGNSLIMVVPATLLMVNVLSDNKNNKWYARGLNMFLILALINQYIRLFYAA